MLRMWRLASLVVATAWLVFVDSVPLRAIGPAILMLPASLDECIAGWILPPATSQWIQEQAERVAN